MAIQIERRHGSAPAKRRTWFEARPRRSERHGSRTRVRRWQRHSALSAFVWSLAWVATLMLLFGIALTWGDANPHNHVVHAVMRVGTWLATPFNDVFRNADARKQLTENWAFAAGVYVIAGRVLAWLLRW